MTRDGDPGPGEIGLMAPIRFTDPITDIVNVVTVPIRSFSEGSQATLWASGLTPLEMAAGETKVFIATYPKPDSDSNHVGVAEWTTLAATTDYRANANAQGTGANRTTSISVVATEAANTLRMEVTNNHSGSVFLTRLQARGMASD